MIARAAPATIFALLLLCPFAAQALLRPTEPYLTGTAACEKLMGERAGARVTVPFDWNAPNGPTTTIFYSVIGAALDPRKPTVVFVNGGPGGNPLSNQQTLEPLTPHFNVITFHQRGVLCSRPATAAEIDDHRYYSSRHTALDLERIRETLGIERWAVWGHSYGTVPATIYAHLFPASVQSLVLEGVVVRGDPDNWQNPHRRKLLERWFRTLPPDLRRKVLRWSEYPGVSPTWFSQLAFPYMYYSDPFSLIERSLADLFDNTDEWILRVLTELSKPGVPLQDDPDFGQFAWVHLLCREFSGSNALLSRHFVVDRDGRFLPAQAQNDVVPECAARGIASSSHYDAARFPLTVPVTYFNGTLDGATPSPNAVSHFREAARGRAQLFLVENSGHISVADLNKEGAFLPLLREVLLGKTLTDPELAAWNSSQPRKIRWARKK